jgi:pimeloyl-ACP methyl ester carboxylesterase
VVPTKIKPAYPKDYLLRENSLSIIVSTRSNDMATPQTVKTSYIKSKDVTYAYRRLGNSADGIPLLMLHHFRGVMDVWDPLFISLLAKQREVILFDNAGVGKSTGEVPDSIKEMAAHVVEFLAALKISSLDIYGFSMGGFIGQQLALDHPSLVHKLILSGTGPGVGSEDPQIASPNDARVGELATGESPDLAAMTTLFFYPTETSKAAAVEWWGRIHERSKETSGEERTTFIWGPGVMAMATALHKWKNGEGKVE